MNDNPASAMKQRIFRADHVGSFLRPATLVDARKKREAGAISSAELCAIEDQAIRDLVRRQEDIGLRVVTDGDYRRGAFHIDFLTRLRGIEWNPRPFAGSFKEGGSAGLSPAVFECKAKVEHVREGVDLHVRETGVQAVLEVRSAEHADSVIEAARAAGYGIERIETR